MSAGFFLYTHFRKPLHEMLLPIFRVGLPFSLRHLWKHLYSHSQRCAYWVILSPVKMTIKTQPQQVQQETFLSRGPPGCHRLRSHLNCTKPPLSSSEWQPGPCVVDSHLPGRGERALWWVCRSVHTLLMKCLWGYVCF